MDLVRPLCLAPTRILTGDLVRALCLSVVAYLSLVDGAEDFYDDGAALGFARKVFSNLGDNLGDVDKTVLQNQAEFNALDFEAVKYLQGLFEMRVSDLQTTLEHTHSMLDVVVALAVNRSLSKQEPVQPQGAGNAG